MEISTSVLEELHKVSTRREHTFAVLTDVDGTPIAVRPDAVLHVRPHETVSEPPNVLAATAQTGSDWPRACSVSCHRRAAVAWSLAES